jgi:putative transcriptional regulator
MFGIFYLPFDFIGIKIGVVPVLVVVAVQKVRKNLGITQAELASSAGVSQRTISDIERGSHLPRIDVALYISRRLGVPVDKLFIIPI